MSTVLLCDHQVLIISERLYGKFRSNMKESLKEPVPILICTWRFSVFVCIFSFPLFLSSREVLPSANSIRSKMTTRTALLVALLLSPSSIFPLSDHFSSPLKVYSGFILAKADLRVKIVFPPSPSSSSEAQSLEVFSRLCTLCMTQSGESSTVSNSSVMQPYSCFI